MSVVLKLATATDELSANAVATLQEVLDDVNAKRVTSVGIAYVTRDGHIGSVFSESDDIGRMLGAVTLLGHRVAAALEGSLVDDDGGDDDDPDDDGGLDASDSAPAAATA